MLPHRPSPSRRSVLAGVAASLTPTSTRSLQDTRIDGITLNDASHLNPTQVARHVILDDPDQGNMIAASRQILARAAAENRAVVVGGARHSMGGQSLCRDAAALTQAAFVCAPEPASKIYRVTAGARWSNVVPALDQIGRSVAVMQSNNDFSVGGTLSVNGHGWAVPFGAFASTVRTFRMMLADGTVVTCSRTENANLFAAAIGGYGLLGIVLDAELDMVENTMLQPRIETMKADTLADAFVGAIRPETGVGMAYGRVSVAPGSFLQEALLVTFRRTNDPTHSLPKDHDAIFSFLSRTLLRQQIGSPSGKTARWWAETTLAPHLAPALVTRNRLLNQPVGSLGKAGAGRTDILHEYFLPPARLAEFFLACRESIPRSGQDLLNVTLRYVAADPVSLLTFAPEPRIAAVFLFSHERTEGADVAMQRLTETMVEDALALGGSFYLPYRLHARRDQVTRAYPQIDAFRALKRLCDPASRFQNMLFEAYLS